jgi:TatD DNase family protein
MMIIDTHTHLYAKEFDEDRAEMVQRAKDAGVVLMLLPAIDSSSFDAMWQTVHAHAAVMKPMIGLHPCSVKPETVEAELELVKTELDTNRGKYVAVGEIGIDLYWDKTTLDYQTEAFRTQLQWAKQFRLPVAIHIRNSFNEVFEVLQQEQDGTLTGVLHCFTGGKRHVRLARELGFYFGIGGVVTYPGSGIDHVLKRIEMSEIVLETDAPYFAPVPHKGQRNEPAFLTHIASRVAEIKELPVDEVIAITSANAKKLFNL